MCHQILIYIYSTLSNLNCIESSRYFYQFNNSSIKKKTKQKKIRIGCESVSSISVLVVSLLFFPETNGYLDQEAQVGILVQARLMVMIVRDGLLLLMLHERVRSSRQAAQVAQVRVVDAGEILVEIDWTVRCRCGGSCAAGL